jgi:hypothetical protein
LLLEISGWVAGANHDLPWATLLIAAAAAVSRDIGAPLHPSDLGELHNECERSARDELGVAGFDAAWRRGSSLSLEQAVAAALAQTPGQLDTLVEHPDAAACQATSGPGD